MKNFIRLLIGSGENCADIRYASGISTPDDFIFFEYGNSHCAIMSALEIDRAKANAKPGVEVIPESSFGKITRTNICSAIAEKCQCRNFIVPDSFPLGLADKMRQAGLTVVPDDRSFFPEREFKSDTEVRFIIEAQRAAEAGLAQAVEILRQSEINGDELLWNGKLLTSEILRAEIDSAILRCGMLPTGTICAGGSQGAQPHNAGSGILFAHTPIVMDIFPRSAASGYWGDLTRTVVKGEAPEIVRKAYAAVLEARECAKAAIAIGVSGRTLHEIADNVLQKHHFFTGEDNGTPFGFFHGLGHGVGLEIHEAPRLSPRSDSVLQGGEIMTIEPGVYYSEWGGIRLEDLIYLDREGKTHCLTEAPDFLTLE